MHQAQWYFDFISPFAYLQWHALKRLQPRLRIKPQPILLAALLNHHGHRGPAEIPGKRLFTYRFVQWQAGQAGLPLRFPPAHPFNPLPALRLAVALDASEPVIDELFELIWGQGQLPEPAALDAIAQRRAGVPALELIERPEVKERVRANTVAALAAGVFGVPTVVLDGQLFWGNDATPMLEACLDDPRLFQAAEYQRLEALPMAASRA